MKGIPIGRSAGLTLFALAFAWIESAVVHYLHLHFYPGGFAFPLVPWPPELVWIEVGREIGTVIVLATVALLAGRSGWSRFAWFMFCFGIWDIFYYIWLNLFEGWPPSFLTDDLLFLVPTPWTGPVLAPMLVSLGLILSALLILRRDVDFSGFRPRRFTLLLTLAGWGVILAGFIMESGEVMRAGALPPFRWEFFAAGMALWIAGIILEWRFPGARA